METKQIIKEAVTRMKMLELNPKIIEEFLESRTIYVSDLHDDKLQVTSEEQKQIIAECEKEKNVLVYHAIHEKTKCKDNLYLLYVEPNEKEWKAEHKDLAMRFAITHAYKKTKEIRVIGIRTKNGRINCITN